MNLDELRNLSNLDPNNIGNWPTPVKATVIVFLCVATLAAGYWFDTKNQIENLEQAQKKEADLRTSFETKQRRAANLEPLKRQLAEIRQSFGAMLRLLPNKTELEGLLVDISQAGLASGLEFDLFKPGAEVLADFYAIQPIKIHVLGNYHEFGAFASAVAALPRIVTQHDISIRPHRGNGKGDQDLTMELTAKTYRYLEEGEMTK